MRGTRGWALNGGLIPAWLRFRHPPLAVVAGFTAIVAIGTSLLMLPIARVGVGGATLANPHAGPDSVVVIGLGRFGTSLAFGIEVLGIDADPKIVQDLAGRLTHAVQADPTDEQALRQLSVDEFDRAVIGIGTDIEASILTATVIIDLGVPDIWAKAISQAHTRILTRLGVHHVVRRSTTWDAGSRTWWPGRCWITSSSMTDSRWRNDTTQGLGRPASGRQPLAIQVRGHAGGGQTRRTGLHLRDRGHGAIAGRPGHRLRADPGCRTLQRPDLISVGCVPALWCYRDGGRD